MDTITAVPVPTSAELKRMLFDLVDKSITCTDSPIAPDAGGPYVAVYEGRDGAPLAVLVADLTFAASSAAALAMMPARLVEEAKKDGKLQDSLFDCFREVSNILSALLNTPNTPHVVLRRVVSTTDELDDAERAVLRAERRLTQIVEIKGFGTGYCGFAAAG